MTGVKWPLPASILIFLQQIIAFIMSVMSCLDRFIAFCFFRTIFVIYPFFPFFFIKKKTLTKNETKLKTSEFTVFNESCNYLQFFFTPSSMISWLLIMLAMLFTFLFSLFFFLVPTFLSLLLLFFLSKHNILRIIPYALWQKLQLHPLSLSLPSAIQSIQFNSIHTPLFSFFLSTTAGISFFFFLFLSAFYMIP